MDERVHGRAVLLGRGRTGHSSLQLTEGMAFEDWLALGSQISRISNASSWWLGDWLVYGERQFRNRYRRALDATQLDYQTLRNYAWVARWFEASRRRSSLSFQHHAEVAALPEPDQEVWLQRAGRSRWSRNELRRQLSSARRASRAVSEGPPVVVRIHVAAPREQRWRDAAIAAEQDLVDWIAAAADDAAETALTTDSAPRFSKQPKGTKSRRGRTAKNSVRGRPRSLTH